MLHSLYRYAINNNLNAKWTREKHVPFIIHLDSNGAFQNLEKTVMPKDGGKKFIIPYDNMVSRALGSRAVFACDDFERVLGFGKKSDKNRFFFIALMEESKLEVFQPVIQFLNNGTERNKAIETLNNVTERNKAIETLKNDSIGLVIFFVDGENTITKDVLEYWENKKSTKTTETPNGVCSITGKPAKLLERLPQMKGVFGTKGVSIFSFDKPSYESYGLKASLNCPISLGAVESIQAAITKLVERSRESGISRLIGGEHFIFWMNKKNDLDSFNIILDPKESDIQDMMLSKAKVKDVEDDIFHGAIVTNVKTRFVVRSYYQSTLSEFKDNIINWHSDNAIGDGIGVKMRNVIDGIAPIKNGNPNSSYIPTSTIRDIFNSAYFGKPISDKVYNLALHRENSEMFGANKTKFNGRNARLGIIKAYLIRSGTNMNSNMEEVMNTNPFIFGRILALVDNAQYNAIENVQKSISESMWTKFSENPWLVLENLTSKLIKAYLPKIRRDNRGKSVNIENEFNKLMNSITPDKKAFNITEKGIFVLGYTYQKNLYFSFKKTTELTINSQE